MDALALRPEQRQHLGRLRPSRTEPMRRASVEFGHLAGLHDEVVLAQSQPQAAGQNVHPLVALVGLLLAGRLARRAPDRRGLVPLGLQPAELRQGEQLIGTYIEADFAGATKVPGLWVAGNLAQPMAQPMAAASAGLTAGAAINYDLILEETSRAVKDKVPFL